MAGSVNKVILVGNLGRDPEVRTMSNGSKVCNLSVATSETWKDRNTGERREKTEWHRVVLFNSALVDVAERYLRKGSKVYLEGQIETREWEQDGQRRYTTEVVLRPYRGELTMLDGRSEGGGYGASAGGADYGDRGGDRGGSHDGGGRSGGGYGGGRGGARKDAPAYGGPASGGAGGLPGGDVGGGFDDEIPF